MPEDHHVSVSDTIIEDIAVLKAGDNELRRVIDDGNRATQQSIAMLQGRVESLADMMRSVATLQAQHESQRDGLGRAFAEIAETDKALADHIEDSTGWRKEHEKENAVTERKLSLWQGIAFGVTLTIGVAASIAVWAGSLLLNNLRSDIVETRTVQSATQKEHDARLDKLERDAAREHAK